MALLHVVFRASSLLYYKHKATAHSRGKLCILFRRLVVVFCVISVCLWFWNNEHDQLSYICISSSTSTKYWPHLANSKTSKVILQARRTHLRHILKTNCVFYLSIDMKMLISNLVRTTRLWNNLHKVTRFNILVLLLYCIVILFVYRFHYCIVVSWNIVSWHYGFVLLVYCILTVFWFCADICVYIYLSCTTIKKKPHICLLYSFFVLSFFPIK